MSDTSAGSPAGVPSEAPRDVFYLLSIFFAVTSTTSLLLYLIWSYFKRHQERIIRRYHLVVVNYKKMIYNLDVSWSTMGWFSVSISFTIYNKWIMQLWEGGFNYPISMTTLHMAFKVRKGCTGEACCVKCNCLYVCITF